jgi:hypothetical protein
VTTAEFDPERLLTALSGDVAVLRARMSELATAVDAVTARQLGDTTAVDERLDALSAQIREIAALAEQSSGKGPAWDWSSMPRPKADRAWLELITWIDEVLLPRNPTLQHGEWAACWYLHPDAIDELSALYGTWKLAYTGSGATAARIAEWRDRWLPGTRTRLKTLFAQCQKPQTGHRAARPGVVTDTDALHAFIRADLDSRPLA